MSSYRTLIKVGEFLFAAGKSLFAETDLGKLLPLAMDKVIEYTNAQHGMIIVYSPEGELLFQVARDHHHKDIEQPEKEFSTTIVQRVRESGQPVVIEDALEDPSVNKKLSTLRIGILSAAGAPLRHEGEFLGVIYIDNREVKAAFDDETGILLSEFAELISVAVKNALKLQRVESEAAQTKLKLRDEMKYRRQLEERLAKSEGYDEIIGLKSMAMLEACNQIEKVADTESSVLIIGETGTGKGLIAQTLHRKSRRAAQRFISLNCAALPEELLFSELFGHVKGAFTGAIADQAGYFETADGGTIFLDEIAKSTLKFQTQLLRVLESNEFNYLGQPGKIRKTDVRIISAAGPNLQELIKKGEFYPDLYYRLAQFVIRIPPLRERREDLPELAHHFLQHFAEKEKKPVRSFSAEALELLLRHDWPGNVRELRNAVSSAVISAEDETIGAEDLDLPDPFYPPPPPEWNYRLLKKQNIEDFDQTFFRKILRETQGHVTKAAELAGMDKKNFIQKLKLYKINWKDFAQTE